MYVLLVDQLERWAMSERQVAATLMAAGAEVEMPNPVEMRKQFDESLLAPFEFADGSMSRWRRAVGLSA